MITPPQPLDEFEQENSVAAEMRAEERAKASQPHKTIIAEDAFDHYPYSKLDKEILSGKFDSEKHVLKQRVLQLETALERTEKELSALKAKLAGGILIEQRKNVRPQGILDQK
jgi:hypothetical protein